MEYTSKIYVAGHRGMVGSAIVRKLKDEGYTNIITQDSKKLDLRNQQAVHDFFSVCKPEYVFLAAAKVGGIAANNTYRADFIYDNLIMECNVIKSSFDSGVTKLMFLGSSCIYPKLATQPLKEESLLTGILEETNEPYAIAKIAGIKLCESYRRQYGCNYISIMPTNLYGPNDNYSLQNSHVLPALLRKFYTAINEQQPHVEIWGTGSPMREFLHVDDLANACYFLMMNYNDEGFVNVGSGIDISIKDLAMLVKQITGYKGDLKFDSTKPDGTPKKLMDVTKLTALGWKYNISLNKGIEMVWKEVKDGKFFERAV